jgi:hypothetical protein
MSDQPRKEGKAFDMSPEGSTIAEESATKAKVRQAKTFIPHHTEILNEVPEAITAGERLPHISDYSGISLEAIPVKGLKSFFMDPVCCCWL